MDSYGRKINASIPVLDSKFCQPHIMLLMVKKPEKRIFSSTCFTVLDVNGNQLLKIVKGDSFFKRKERIILDSTGSPVATLCRKNFSLNDVWRVYRGKYSKDKDGLLRVMRKDKLTLNVLMGSKCRAKDKINKGDFDMVGLPPAIYMGDTKIADVNNFAWGGDDAKKGFKVIVGQGTDYAFIICLLIICKEMAMPSRASGSTGEALLHDGMDIVSVTVGGACGGGGCGGGGCGG